MRATFFAVSALHLATALAAQGLPPVPAPMQNPITAEKAVLGKILFWDEQLSSDDTVACGTCHMPGAAGGADPRLGLHPGLDGRPHTADDVLASLGIVRQDAA
ncbi:MAG: cytochrome c peroxidase, partial [Planctomycetota bacterium]